jgi:hypothetical protein
MSSESIPLLGTVHAARCWIRSTDGDQTFVHSYADRPPVYFLAGSEPRFGAGRQPRRYQLSRRTSGTGIRRRADWGWGPDGTITDSAGNAVPGASAVNSIASLTHVAWLSPKKLLGGWYGVEVVLSAAHVNAGALEKAGGLGNTTVAPFILQWPEHRVFGLAIDQRVTADFDLPTGQYSRTSDVNISSNAFTVHPYYSITVFPEKRIETSWRVHYRWNSIKQRSSYKHRCAIHSGWPSHSFQCNRCLQPLERPMDRP